MKLDAKRREYDIVVIGEESHLAYNRVGLTSFFQHRKVENLYLNPKEWVRFRPTMRRLQGELILNSTQTAQKGR
jgi:nitrite reductase (NAD(P)H)